jgi:hypothetical protein
MRRTAILVAVAFCGCAHQPSYQEQILRIEIPADDHGRDRLCGWLRQEMARQQSLSAASGGSQYALAFQAMARSNTAALEEKASEVPCNAAFGAVRSTPIQAPSIDQCVSDCKRITGQDVNACFNSCKK